MMLPPTGAKAERQSFLQQCNNCSRKARKVPLHVIKEVAALYPKTQVPRFLREFYSEYGRQAFDRAFDAALFAMESDKSPGTFWDKISTENQGVVALIHDELREEVYRLVNLLVEEDFTNLTARQLFEITGVAYKIFVKGELHTREKIQEGRQRLIFSSPLHMTILERMWFQQQNEAEIASANSGSTIPSRPGTPFTREGALALKKVLETFGGDLVSTDQSGWDTRVTGWLMDSDIDRRFECIEGEAAERGRWLRGARNLNMIVKYKTIVFSDGHVLFQLLPGWWPSGSYRTSSTNSANRVTIRKLATGDCCAITMGDDAVEKWLEDLYERYASWGFKLKGHTDVTPEDFEFCSKIFRNGIVVPVDTSVRKMILNVYRHDTPASRMSIKLELKHHPRLQEFIDLGVLDEDPEESDW